MTISNSIRTAGPFLGNGTTNIFPFSFKVFDRSDLLVAVTNTATNVETLLTLDADYTVTLNSNQNASPGGIITTTVAPATGTTLSATSNINVTQSLDLTNQGGFYPRAINDALDRIVIMIQQISAKVGGGLGIGVAALLALMQAKLGRIVNPIDFGAKGDGITDDTAAIQAAINAAKVIRLDDFANYVISSPVVLPSKRRIIGNNATFTAASQALSAFFTANSLAVNDVNISDVIFDGKGTFGGSGATAKFSNANVGIYLNAGGSNWRIQNCKFTGMDRAATLTAGDQVSITNNHVLNNGLAGFSLTNVTNFEVSNNIINGVLGDDNYPGNTYGKFGDGIYLDACVGGVVAGNQITRCVRIGICLESSTSAVNKNISISGNSISDLTNSRNTEANCGIWVEGGKSDGSVSITGNTVRYTSAWTGQKAYGILCLNGGTVTGNYLYGPGTGTSSGYGVQAGIGSTVVADNHIQGFEAGVLVSGPRVEDFIYAVKDNTIVSNWGYGVYVLAVGSHFDITGNVIKDNGWNLTLPANGYGGVGIQLKSGSGYVPKARINNNTFISSANQGDTKGQLCSIILGNGSGGLPLVYGMKSNDFIFRGTFTTPYPNQTVLPICYGQDSGGGTITILRDIIGDRYGNTCTKATMQQGAIINSFSGTPRYMGLASSIPSTAFPTMPALIGDYYENAGITAGGPEGWYCTASGTPGTWSPTGIVGASQCSRVNPTSGATLTTLETNVNALLTALQNSKLMF